MHKDIDDLLPLKISITIVNDIIHDAVRLRASDIHLEPFELEMGVRFHIDGVLQEITTIPKDRISEVVSRIKIMSRMDIAEKRRSQDGRIRISEQGKDIDIRASSLPTDFGEKVVLRILDKSGFDYNLNSIGMDPQRLSKFKKSYPVAQWYRTSELKRVERTNQMKLKVKIRIQNS